MYDSNEARGILHMRMKEGCEFFKCLPVNVIFFSFLFFCICKSVCEFIIVQLQAKLHWMLFVLVLAQTDIMTELFSKCLVVAQPSLRHSKANAQRLPSIPEIQILDWSNGLETGRTLVHINLQHSKHYHTQRVSSNPKICCFLCKKYMPFTSEQEFTAKCKCLNHMQKCEHELNQWVDLNTWSVDILI